MMRNPFRARSQVAGSAHDRTPLSRTYWVLATYLILVFLTGGGSRGDIASLIFLRPIAVLVGAWAFLQLDGSTLRQWRGLLVLAALLFLLPALHLVPLPAGLWHALPGRDLVVAISEATGSADRARPLSLSPLDTVNALFSLFVPLAALLLAIGLDDRERRLTLLIVLTAGAITAVVGALQALSPGSGALHFYRLDNVNAASGLFANRNHQALFLACLLPMLAVFSASGAHGLVRHIFVMATGVVILLPLLLVTGSRAGLVLSMVAMLSLLAVMPRAQGDCKRQGRLAWVNDPRLLIAAAIAVLSAVIALSSRAEAFKRLFASSMAEESRLHIWEPALRATTDLMPFGSGIGSFVRTYQVYETHDLLTPTYRNHAHNEFIEVAMTGGVAAVVILLVVVAAWARLSWKWMRLSPRSPEVLYGRLGAIVLLLFAIASAVDYPARVPSMACLMVVAAVWLRGKTASPAVDQARADGIVNSFTPRTS